MQGVETTHVIADIAVIAVIGKAKSTTEAQRRGEKKGCVLDKLHEIEERSVET